MGRPSKKAKYLGMENKNKHGTTMKIVEYNKADDIIIEFQDEHKYRKRVQLTKFLRGGVANPYDKTVCEVGYRGENGDVNFNDAVESHIYHVWRGMLARCYNKEEQAHYYQGCVVDSKWHNYTNFKKWYYENNYTTSSKNKRYMLNLDKDILVPFNKIYSENTCVLVPACINSYFVSMARPNIIKNKNRFNLIISQNNYPSFEGSFKTYQEAEIEYWKIKKQRLIDLCEECKDFLPKNIYDLFVNLDLTKYKKGANNE